MEFAGMGAANDLIQTLTRVLFVIKNILTTGIIDEAKKFSANLVESLLVVFEKEKIFMHCPRCGQHQPSDKTGFCTKCGMDMSEVKEILVPKQLREVKKKKRRNIEKGIRQGVAMMIFGFVLTMILAILRDMNLVPAISVKLATLVFCLGGVVRMAMPFIFGASASPDKKNASLEYDAAADALTDKHPAEKSLPEAQYQPPVNFAAKIYDTAEMIPPSSVTENTTRQLKNQLEQE